MRFLGQSPRNDIRWIIVFYQNSMLKVLYPQFSAKIVGNHYHQSLKACFTMDVKKIAEELRDRLRKYDDFIGLYLYGSQATGAASPESDIDIVGIFETNRDHSREVIRDAWDIEINNDIVIDFHPMTLEQLNADPFYFNEIKKGLYFAR